MKRETISEALNALEDRFVTEAADYRPGAIQETPERIVYMKTKRIISIALAAALVLALGIGAYAAFYSMDHRVPESTETFRIHWEDSPSGYLQWQDAKLAVTFPDTAESKEIEFRPGWLPEEMAALQNGEWRSRLTAEALPFPDSPLFVPAYADMSQPLLIDSFSMAQFNGGGALLLLYFTPGEITQERWDEQGVDVMRFHATQHFDAVPEREVPEHTLEQNILLLSNAEEGWVLRVAGELSMDELVRIARELEIRPTGRVWTPEEFENRFAILDGGVG